MLYFDCILTIIRKCPSKQLNTIHMVLMRGLMLKGLQLGKFYFHKVQNNMKILWCLKDFFFTIFKIKIIQLIASRLGIS